MSTAASGKERKAEMTDSKPIEDRDENEQEEWHERTRNQILMFAVGIVLFGLVLGLILDWYIDPQTSTQKKDLVQALGLITAGVAGAVVIFFTWRGQERNQRNTQEQFRLTRQSQEENQKSTQAQLENAQEELRLTRQGQMTERFTQAIEQLGSEKLEIKLGGIYSLERTAHEAKNYHWPVMEVLTSYVRRHAARKPDKELRENAATPEPDIQAILDVIGRRSAYYRIDKKVEYGTIELNNTDLQGANLQEAHLKGANLQGANLQEAHLEGANLFRADLVGTNLLGAILQRAILQRAILQEAILQRAILQEAILQETILQGTDLVGANLYGADLQEAALREAALRGANLYGADLRGANLQGADLLGADLQEADLQGANLYGANLYGANLYGASGITEDQIEWTLGSNETKLGEDLKRPELWCKGFIEQATIIREHIGGG